MALFAEVVCTELTDVGGKHWTQTYFSPVMAHLDIRSKIGLLDY